jgi:hypothetical protein
MARVELRLLQGLDGRNAPSHHGRAAAMGRRRRAVNSSHLEAWLGLWLAQGALVMLPGRPIGSPWSWCPRPLWPSRVLPPAMVFRVYRGIREEGVEQGCSVAEPPELFRFKCTNHCYKGKMISNALQMEQPMGLSGHHPMQPRLHRIKVGYTLYKMSSRYITAQAFITE